MAAEELSSARADAVRTTRTGTRPAAAFGLLTLLTAAAWALVVTMHYWWAWLWTKLGVVSVPVDTSVWILAIILTILLTPVLWHRFHSVWLVGCLVGVLFVGGTTTVLSPWHDVLAKAWLRAECGPGDCATPQLPAIDPGRVANR